ncbi:biofilm PGA synthesis lipoprotein PgaB [Propionispora vibrioides]|uniref:Biofilm PGA synthesis lipoprotein PgaB n=2 Tax=Propionispora vibrioides TaxID=112903 RepID=A0A1H8V2M3_9FIRM|nr:biofilm PGA synthesis lipoprotein PgaB [Propionispora vibrioides]
MAIMNKKIVGALVFCMLILLICSPSLANAKEVLVLCYHNVTDQPGQDIYAVTPANLKSHLTYLKEQGYTPISLKEYIAASQTGAALPDKSVLLTFDDGYQSVYTKVFPLLKEYRYPGMIAIVTSWLDYAPAELGPLVTWQQIREMENSGLIDVASHSHDMHRFTVVTPQGDRGPLLSRLQYKNGRYETIAEQRERVRRDLHESQAVFNKELGHTVQAVVWPYGAYTPFAVTDALQEGFEACFTLNDGVNHPGEQALQAANRLIITGNPSKEHFASLLKANSEAAKVPVKAIQLDLDMIYDPGSAVQTEENLNLAIERIRSSGANTIYLQSFSDEDGSGNSKSVYFYTKEAPVKADLFSHVIGRLREEGRFSIYAWFPTLAAQWLLEDSPQDAVVAYDEKNKGWYRRATPFSSRVSDRLSALVADLAAYNDINGILFQDDVYLNDFEDFSPAARQVFKEQTGFELSPQLLKERPELNERWVRLKTDRLTGLTVKLWETAGNYRSNLGSARNIYPIVITSPAAEEWLGQNYEQYLKTYTYTVIMAYPYLEKAYQNPDGWLENLATAALSNRENAQKTVFKLQTYDWNKKHWLSEAEIRRQTEVLRKKGVIHIAYYPENVYSEQ